MKSYFSSLVAFLIALYLGLISLANENNIGRKMERGFEKVTEKSVRAGRNAKYHVSDASITSQVKARLLADDEVKAYKIKVKTVGRVVYLSGYAPDNASIRKSTQIARQVKGVVNVVNTIETRTN